MNLEALLTKEDGTDIMVQECIAVVKNSTKVILFGAGVGGGQLYALLHKHSLLNKVVAFADNNQYKWNKEYMSTGVIVEEPEKIYEKYGQDITIIVSSSAYTQILEQLLSYGGKKENIHLFNFAFMDLDYTDKEFIYDHISEFERAYNRMADEKSKRIFVNILNYKISKNNRYLEEMATDTDDEYYQYFDNELFQFVEEERFCDLGAYTGDTLEKLEKFYNGKWSKYYGFEADDTIYEELKQFIINKKISQEKASLFNVAAWDKEETLYFEHSAGSSEMGQSSDKNNESEVLGKRVDDLLNDTKISFVKMDIEGAEYKAISGMKNVIKKNKPVLAICVYHKRDDFFSLTDLIEEICPGEYTFFFRQYRYTPTETVCYGIPKKRMIVKGEN